MEEALSKLDQNDKLAFSNSNSMQKSKTHTPTFEIP